MSAARTSEFGHAWWTGHPTERFWLGVARPTDAGDVLAAPCTFGRTVPTGSHGLIRHVTEGDAVFRFDPERAAIVSWSVACGTAGRCTLPWTVPGCGPGTSSSSRQPLPSWSIALGADTPLPAIVPLTRIAQLQAGLFPVLQAFEDAVGEPLHYPFAIGHPADTHLLDGHVFKLPALFVEACPELVEVAGRMRWSALAQLRARDPERKWDIRVGVPARASAMPSVAASRNSSSGAAAAPPVVPARG